MKKSGLLKIGAFFAVGSGAILVLVGLVTSFGADFYTYAVKGIFFGTGAINIAIGLIALGVYESLPSSEGIPQEVLATKAMPIQQPVVTPVVPQPVAQPAPAPVYEPVAQPAPTPVYEPVAQPAPTPYVEPVVSAPQPEPVVQPAPAPAYEPTPVAVAPSVDPVDDMVAQYMTEPVFEPVPVFEPSATTEPAPTPAAPVAPSPEVAEKIQKLTELYEQGAVSDAEFELLKSKLMNSEL